MKRVTQEPKKHTKKKLAVRHHPFERAQVWAEKRLERAKVERQKAAEKLSKLDVEIPDLERKIAALKPVPERRPISDFPKQDVIRTSRDQELLPDLIGQPETVDSDDLIDQADRLLTRQLGQR